MRTKICTNCNEEKLSVKFGKNKRSKDGLTVYCALCTAKLWRERYYKNKEKRRAAIKVYRDKNTEAVRERNKLSRIRNHRSRSETTLMRRYGITHEQKDKMFEDQKGCCAICGRHDSEFTKGLHIDHSHRSGKTRALLCYQCNVFKVRSHTIETARAVLEYLLKYDDPEKKVS